MTTINFAIYDRMSALMDKIDFADWLAAEMDRREWSQSDLARKADIHRQVIWSYLNRKRVKPDEDVLSAIARAFKVPPEIVFRAAGLLPVTDKLNEDQEQIVFESSDLTTQERDEVIAFIRMKKNLRNRKNGPTAR